MKYYILWLVTMCVTPICYEVAYTTTNHTIKIVFIILAALCLAFLSFFYRQANKPYDYEKGYKHGYLDARCSDEVEK